MNNLSNQEKHQQMLKEARWTLALFAIAAAWQIVFGFALNGTGLIFLGMPAWFSVSILGGFVISVVGVFILLKKVFVDFEYDEEEEEVTGE